MEMRVDDVHETASCGLAADSVILEGGPFPVNASGGTRAHGNDARFLQ
jgi:hypothetical protein